MNKQQTIGIWGFSRVGSAAARYYVRHGMHPGIFDANPLTSEQQTYCQKEKLYVWSPDQLVPFLEQYDLILPSPGIDLRPYQAYAHKWVSEFDLFCHEYKKPIIAITGSIGKTSITHLLSQLLTNVYGTIATGGNIGIGMLDLLTLDDTKLALLELSSFQLELVQTGSADLAIITNIYPNHLDRHGTLDAYTAAKTRIYKHQTKEQKLLLPYDLVPTLCTMTAPHGQLYCFIDTPIKQAPALPTGCTGIFFQDTAHTLIYLDAHGHTELMSLENLPPITFAQNWLIIASAAHLLGVDLQLLTTSASRFSLPPHRLEYLGCAQGFTFYNDSKATTISSMLAAVKAVAKKKSVHLFIGGLSKGVDREPAIMELPDKLVHAYCFGAEAESLNGLCIKHDIASSSHATLEDAFSLCMTQLNDGQTVLLSPGGASYDLFVDYEQRGTVFTSLVKNYIQNAADQTLQVTPTTCPPPLA